MTWFLPRRLRQDFYNLYAFCRWADNLADEVHDANNSLNLLQWWESELTKCYQSKPSHPIMLALQSTIQKHALPIQPLQDLLDAFRQDQSVFRYDSQAELAEYCQRSANPVGRLILQLAGVATAENVALSDQICTGLQLANFCQDLSRDADLGRIYAPRSLWTSFSVTEELILANKVDPRLQAMLRRWVSLAREHFRLGWPLLHQLPTWLAVDVELFVRGGMSILDEITRADFDVWSKRPTVSSSTKFRILLGGMRSRYVNRPRQLPPPLEDKQLSQSIRWCQQQCLSSQSSFYSSFSLLEYRRRKAMYALYAFARITDDLVDNDRPIPERQQALAKWRLNLAQAMTEPASPKVGAPSQRNDPMDEYQLLWPALVHCVREFDIPVSWLEQLIDGVAVDLCPKPFLDWEELLDYCYRVASTVGLACTHIWRESAAMPYQAAIDCGIAFQLTNILRDVAEDAQRGRLYIPLRELARFNISSEAWLSGRPDGNWQDLVASMVDRTAGLFQSGWHTKHALSRRSQRMFSLIWHNYRSLLHQVHQNTNRLWQLPKVQLSLKQRGYLAYLRTMPLSDKRWFR
ncbi:MAG: squalene synthase HpnC [Planctomycetales bacterium]|nr:squalene synthase HpnC [Planctomycetales bacterium]